MKRRRRALTTMGKTKPKTQVLITRRSLSSTPCLPLLRRLEAEVVVVIIVVTVEAWEEGDAVAPVEAGTGEKKNERGMLLLSENLVVSVYLVQVPTLVDGEDTEETVEGAGAEEDSHLTV